MKRVSAKTFVKTVEERMARGQTYEQASSSLMLDEEKQRSFKEIMESDLPATPPWEGESEFPSDAGMTALEYAETAARDTGKYDEVAWDAPPGDPQEIVTAADARDKMNRRIRGLVSDEDFAVFLLATVDEVPYRRLAKEFHTSKSAIARTVARVRTTLQVGLEDLK